jgi:hypothetical protein
MTETKLVKLDIGINFSFTLIYFGCIVPSTNTTKKIVISIMLKNKINFIEIVLFYLLLLFTCRKFALQQDAGTLQAR